MGHETIDQPLAQSWGHGRPESWEARAVRAHEAAGAAGVELIRKLDHGEGEGAFLVRTAEGRLAVLKIVAGDAPYRPMIEALRARGYPAPALFGAGDLGDLRYE